MQDEKTVEKTAQNESREKPRIEQLFENYSGGYKPEVIDWGKPQGKEIW